MLIPVFSCPDPIRGGKDVLVMCEVYSADGKPHPTNTRAALVKTAKKYAKHESLFGIEQEFTFFKEGRPYGFPIGGFPAPQGGYYCGVGSDEIFGREIVEEHLDNCLAAGLSISGINAEVMVGQWEFQVGPLGPLEVADQLWVARWLLYRTAEDFDVAATLDPKPMKGDWNGAGAHTNFSTKEMREDGGYQYIENGCKALGKKVDLHIKNYGHGIEDRLTGHHETARYDKFSYGVSDRGASIRIPLQVLQGRQGLPRGPSPERQHGPVRGHPADRRHGLLGDLMPHRGEARRPLPPAGAPLPDPCRSIDQTGGVNEMLDQQREYVLRSVEERGVRLIRLWFTDILGNLKSFAISPAELENALEDGMTFDGSSIEGFSRIQESDVLAIPDPDTFELLPWGDAKVPEARVFCDIHNLDGTPFDGDPRQVLRRHVRAAARRRA